MAEVRGDPNKQPDECRASHQIKCPNLKCTYEGMDGERYRCAVCGESYFLDYDDMR